MIFIKADIQTSLVYPNYILQFYTDVLRIFQSLQRYIPRTYLGSIFAMWVTKHLHCNLVFDSMTIRKQLIWNKSKEKFIGMCEYGNNTTMEDSETPATEVLVFMLVSLTGKLKWLIVYFFINKISTSIQADKY